MKTTQILYVAHAAAQASVAPSVGQHRALTTLEERR